MSMLCWRTLVFCDKENKPVWSQCVGNNLVFDIGTLETLQTEVQRLATFVIWDSVWPSSLLLQHKHGSVFDVDDMSELSQWEVQGIGFLFYVEDRLRRVLSLKKN